MRADEGGDASAQILTVAAMRAAEEALIAAGSSVAALMDLAGRGVAEWVWRVAARHPVTVLCGPGNNGGDGYVVAEALRARGIDVAVAAPRPPRTPAARAAREAYRGAVLLDGAERHGEVLVDCLYGSGLARPLTDADAALLARLAGAHRLAVAVDLPSGIDADSGAPLNDRLPAYALTLALGAWKPAHWLMPASAAMGALRLVPIGVAEIAGAARVLGRPRLAAPAPDAHKYTRGLVTVVGGAMPGAAALAAEAAAHAGAGYVRLCADAPARLSHAVVQAREARFDKARAVLVGPGLGDDAAARAKLAAALGAGVPTVADGDALGLLAEMGESELPAPAIVTPHAGEFARLFGAAVGDKLTRTRAAARRIGCVVVNKGPDTVIAAPDGSARVAPRGPSWLSAAGTGDVLAGLCAARLAVTGDPFRAACEAVWLHAEAARRAGSAFVADDLVATIPAALAACL